MTKGKNSSLQAIFESKCAMMPGFNADKDNIGNYKDTGTQWAWLGFQDQEEWNQKGKNENVTFPKCPEPIEGVCDCDHGSSMQFHKEARIYVCLTCHKATEPLTRVDFNDFLPGTDLEKHQ